MGTHQPNKEQASSHTNKGGKEYVKRHIQGKQNLLGKGNKRSHTSFNKSENGTTPGHSTSAEYEITEGHCVSPPGNPMNEKDLDEDRRNGGQTN